jgi:hypothetical protein
MFADARMAAALVHRRRRHPARAGSGAPSNLLRGAATSPRAGWLGDARTEAIGNGWIDRAEEFLLGSEEALGQALPEESRRR